jgi:hypothetical protein
VPVQVTLNGASIKQLFTSPQGIVMRDMYRRGLRVESAAKRGCPVDHGRLRGSITTQIVQSRGKSVVRVGTNVSYARYVHDGTGVYGPRGAPIRPRRAKVLVFELNGTTVFTKQVRGVPPNPFLRNALPAAV